MTPNKLLFIAARMIWRPRIQLLRNCYFPRFVQLFNIDQDPLASVPIIYISMKPSPSRRLLTPKMREGNSMHQKFLKKKRKQFLWTSTGK